MNLTLEEISKAVGGTLDGPGNLKVRGYSIDSRTLNAGELFFAIKGPRFDGHQFLQQAAEKKAAAAVVENRGQTGEFPFSSTKKGIHPSGPDFPVIRVANTIEALQSLAREVR